MSVDAPARRPRRPAGGLRPILYGSSIAILVWAAMIVPLPYIEQVPARPTPIAPLVEIDGIATTPLDGATSLLTIHLRQQPTFPAIGAWLDPDRTLLPVGTVYPEGVDREEHLLAERERFGRQFEIAAAVGARAAGVEVSIVTEAVIVAVLPDSPAEGTLEPGDVVVTADGRQIVAGEELQAITLASDPGDVLALTVRRQERLRDLEVTLAAFGEDGQTRLGVGVQTAVDELRLPFDIALADGTRIGGPSAGLMVGLTVFDLLSEENLLAGRSVMGTGTLDADGTVGPVGGVPQKMVAAAEAGAEVVFVPSVQLEQAEQHAPEGLTLVGVANLDEALAYLRGGAGAG